MKLLSFMVGLAVVDHRCMLGTVGWHTQGVLFLVVLLEVVLP